MGINFECDNTAGSGSQEIAINPGWNSQASLEIPNHQQVKYKATESILPSLDLFIPLSDSAKLKASQSESPQKLKADWCQELINENREFLKALFQQNKADYKGTDYIELAQLESMLRDNRDLSPRQFELLAFLERNKNLFKNQKDDLSGSKISRDDIATLIGIFANPNASAENKKCLDEIWCPYGLGQKFELVSQLEKLGMLQLYGPLADWKNAIKPEAIKQGGTGDCYFLSALAAIVSQNSGRKLVRDMIKPVNDESGKLSHYEVKFPGYEKSLRVNPPSPAELSLYARENGHGTWVRVLEEAWNQVRNLQNPRRFVDEGQMPSTEGGDNGGKISEAMKVLMKDKCEDWLLTFTFNSTVKAALKDLSEGKAVITAGSAGSLPVEGPADTKNEAVSENGTVIYSGHAYAVVAYDPATETLTLSNPHGRNEKIGKGGKPEQVSAQFELSYKEFLKYFSQMGVSRQ